MALEFVDGLESVTSGAQLDPEKWDVASTFSTLSTTGGRFNGHRVRLTTGAVAQKTVGLSSTKVAGCIRRVNQFNASQIIAFSETGNRNHLVVYSDLSGRIRFQRSITRIGVSTGPVLRTGIWQTIEVKVFVHDTTGTIDVWVDGVSVSSQTGLDTRDAGATGQTDIVKFYGGGGTIEYSGFYILDGSGSAPQNDILGDFRIDTLFPTSDGTYTELGTTIPASPTTHWDKVEEVGPDDDTSYNEGTAANQRDTFGMENLPTITAQTIFNIQCFSYAKHDGTATNMRNKLRISGSDFDGASQALGSAYTYMLESWDDDPNATAAWTESVINGLESGYEEL